MNTEPNPDKPETPMEKSQAPESPKKNRKPLSSFLVALVLLCLVGLLTQRKRFEAVALSPLPKDLGTQATYRIVHQFPHDPHCYTQGLVYRNGILYESCGLYGQSSLRKIDLQNNTLLAENKLDPSYFAEGLTMMGDSLCQLTWKEGKAFVYSAVDLSLLASFDYQTEGWGLTNNGQRLLLSDGSDTLYWMRPSDGFVNGKLQVTLNGQPVRNLNELEMINGEIFANVYMSNKILRIDAQSGQVLTVIDLSGLDPANAKAGEVLNGIAWDADNGRLFVTGKNWPSLYEIEIISAESLTSPTSSIGPIVP